MKRKVVLRLLSLVMVASMTGTMLPSNIQTASAEEVDVTENQRIIAGNAQFTGIAAGRGVRFTTGLLLLGKGLGMRETPIRPHS